MLCNQKRYCTGKPRNHNGFWAFSYEWQDGSQKVTIRGNLWFHQYDQQGGDAIDFVRRFYNKDYIYLADRANKDGECWPAIPTIARELKLSQSTVRRALQDLRKAGFLETEQRYRKHGGKSSLLYSLKR